MQMQSVSEHFPGALPEDDFVIKSYDLLRKHGFKRGNTLACVGICRDEASQSLATTAQNLWGLAFSLSGLAGLMHAGKTGFGAASHHAPAPGPNDDKTRFVFYGLTHIGVDEDGALGKCNCREQGHSSTACGALVAFQQELQSGMSDLSMADGDIEMSALRNRLWKILDGVATPDILTVTQAAHQAIKEDIETLSAAVLDPAKSDYAVFTGIQLNLSKMNYVFPGDAYLMRDGTRTDFSPVG